VVHARKSRILQAWGVSSGQHFSPSELYFGLCPHRLCPHRLCPHRVAFTVSVCMYVCVHFRVCA
jgi:hypothetical protein